jgi:CubicO group peptidase (beta-lactamase class C family)
MSLAACERPAAAPPPAGQGSDLKARLDTYLAEQVRSRGIPGVTVAIVRGGKVIYDGAAGVRSLATAEKLTSRHVFHFASVSKPFAATAIMQLVERGKLKLDDKVTSVLPYFRLADERSREITLRQILSHTSGMPDVRDYEWDRPQFDEGAAERYVRSMATEKLLWPPGTGRQYSNMAFDALADVVAKASGTSFESFIKTNIFEPLGMRVSSFIHSEIPAALRTSGHVGKTAQVSSVYPYNRRHAPSSTLNSSVLEMTAWMQANLNRGELGGRRILQASSYELLWAKATRVGPGSFIGLSWFIRDRGGRRVVFHSGGDTGFRSYIMLLPDDGIGVVLASNWDETPREVLIEAILDMVLANR